MSFRTVRLAAPSGIALFSLLGILMTERPVSVALSSAALAVGAASILGWKRLTGWPLMVGMLVPLVGLVVLGHAQSSNLSWMGLCVMAAWVSVTSGVRTAAATFCVLAIVPLTEWTLDPSENGWGAWSMGVAFATVACVFARRLRLTVADLRDAQASLVARSRAEERGRIAAEVHDVIGHALTVSLLHIGTARLALDEELDEARASLRQAEELTRASLDEVRVSVGIMRQAGGLSGTTPLPGARDIGELVSSFRGAGALVELAVTGDVDSVGPSIGLASYRIVQEALTNATRHAPGERVRVDFLVDGDSVDLAVRNGGFSHRRQDVDGSGLMVMRERAEAVGGRLTASPVGDGWLVEAVLPA